MKLDAVILDMDGLMIDSEPFWRQAEIEEFQKVGLHLSEEMCIQTTGIRIDEVCQYWYDKSPWKGLPPLELSVKIRERVEELVFEKGQELPGVHDTVEIVKNMNLPLALCSSSPMSLINTVLKKLDLEAAFDIVCSAEFEKYGKPHPAVYLSVLDKLKSRAEYSITFEDTMAGVISAKAAKVKVAAVPQSEHSGDPRFILADYKLESLNDFDWNAVG